MPDGHDLLWGTKAIADAINRNEFQTSRLLLNGELPARKIGRLWVASRQHLRAHLSDGERAAQHNAA